MRQNIQERYERLREKRRALLQRLKSYSEEKLSFKAGPDKWSATEAIEHLVVVEENFLEQVRTNTPVSILDPEKRTPDKYQVVLKVMRKDVAVDVPHESIEPKGRFSLTELLKRWDDIRERMAVLLEEIEAQGEEGMVYQHPYGGPLNIVEALEFMEVHFDNHARHMELILARAA
jgi:hypothetical protein